MILYLVLMMCLSFNITNQTLYTVHLRYQLCMKTTCNNLKLSLNFIFNMRVRHCSRIIPKHKTILLKTIILNIHRQINSLTIS